MEISIEDENFNETRSFKIEIDKLPDRCPFCNELANPKLKGGNLNSSDDYISSNLLVWEIFFVCTNVRCQKAFIGYYKRIGNHEFEFHNHSKGLYRKENFSGIINSISPKFEKIYNQAFAAEQENLLEICGMGYRKALEFLVKDYCKFHFRDKQDSINKMYLSDLISTYIEHSDIKEITDLAERAAWLGNDETHYFRKWNLHNFSDLKSFIKAIITQIDLKSLDTKSIQEMPLSQTRNKKVSN